MEVFAIARMLAVCSLVLLVAVTAVMLLPSSTAAQGENQKQKWLYKVLTPTQIEQIPLAVDLTSGLDKLGDQGWELVAIEPRYELPSGKQAARYIFKQPK